MLSAGFGVLVIAAAGSALWLAISAARDNTFDLLRSAARSTLAGMTAQIEQHLTAAEDQAAYLARRLADGSLLPDDREEMYGILLGSLAAAPQIVAIAYVRPDGSGFGVGRRSGRIIREEWTEPDPESKTILKKLAEDPTSAKWVGVVWIDVLGKPALELVHPLYRHGEIQGAITSYVSISELSEFLYQVSQRRHLDGVILRGQDQVLAHPAMAGGSRGLGPDHVLPTRGEVGDAVVSRIWQSTPSHYDEIFTGSERKGHLVSAPQGDVIFLYREIEGFDTAPWALGIYFREERLAVPFERLRWALAAGLGILLLAIALSIVFARAIAAPVARLALAALAVRALDLEGTPRLGGSSFKETDQAARAFDDMVGGLRWFETYVPKRLVSQLMQAETGEMASEARDVTVLFTDIAGFTSIASRLDAAALAGLLNAHFSLLATAIEAEDGTIDKYIGDSVMAFWGAPDIQLDHAARACRAALAAARALAEDNEKRERQGLEPLRVRIGLHSGTAVVGNIGAPGRINYTLVGDTVNVAQRLEALSKSLAIPDRAAAILISGDVKDQIGPEFRCTPMGPHRLRGRESETEVFLLEG